LQKAMAELIQQQAKQNGDKTAFEECCQAITAQMKAAFEQAKANRALKVPTLIEFMLDPEVQVYPMVRPGGTLEDLLMD